MTEHPYLDEIDAARTGEGSAAVQEHIAQCAECRASEDELTALAARLVPALWCRRGECRRLALQREPRR